MIRRFAAGAALALLTAGCSEPAGTADPTSGTSLNTGASVNTSADMVTAKPAPGAAPKGKDVSVEDKTEYLSYEHDYPAEVAGIPALERLISQRLAKSKADALAAAREDAEERRRSGFPFHPYELEIEWEVEGDSPRFLSLEGETYAFTGGAHGMTVSQGLLWDRERAGTLPVEALFTSMPGFVRAVRDDFCTGLNAERAEKRGAPVNADSNDEFDRCVDIEKQVLVPLARKGQPFHAVRVVIAPYEAGPYAEGSYEVDLKVTPAMLKTVKPEYRSAFVKG